MTNPRSFAQGDLTHAIIGAAYYVFNVLGWGFAEKVYSAALRYVLSSRGYRVDSEVRVPVFFEGQLIAHHRLDLLMEKEIVIELKVAEALTDRATDQLFNYLVATKLNVGLLLHFSSKGVKAHRREYSPAPSQQSQRSRKSQSSEDTTA